MCAELAEDVVLYLSLSVCVHGERLTIVPFITGKYAHALWRD